MKRYFKYCFILLFLFAFNDSRAQLSNYSFNEEKKFGFSLRYGTMNTTLAPEDEVNDISAILFRPLTIDLSTYEVGGYQVSHRWVFLFETFSAAVVDALDGGEFDWGSMETSTSISDFLLGWHTHAFALFYKDLISLSGGVHWGDYFLSYSPYNQGSDGYAEPIEPSGWYGAMGPAIVADFNLINPYAVLHLEAAYNFSLKFRDLPDMAANETSPDPHFLNLRTLIKTNTIFYGGYEYVRSFARGDKPFNASRSDIFIGIWF